MSNQSWVVNKCFRKNTKIWKTNGQLNFVNKTAVQIF